MEMQLRNKGFWEEDPIPQYGYQGPICYKTVNKQGVLPPKAGNLAPLTTKMHICCAKIAVVCVVIASKFLTSGV